MQAADVAAKKAGTYPASSCAAASTSVVSDSESLCFRSDAESSVLFAQTASTSVVSRNELQSDRMRVTQGIPPNVS